LSGCWPRRNSGHHSATGVPRAVLNRQAAYLQADRIRQWAPRVGDHGHPDTAEHERRETLAMLDLYHQPTVGGGNDRVRDSPHPGARLTGHQRQAAQLTDLDVVVVGCR